MMPLWISSKIWVGRCLGTDSHFLLSFFVYIWINYRQTAIFSLFINFVVESISQLVLYNQNVWIKCGAITIHTED